MRELDQSHNGVMVQTGSPSVSVGGTGHTTSTAPVTEGQKVFFVGPSFHLFIVQPLITLAKEAGIKGHRVEGWDMIARSTPMQHWERGGGNSKVKKALRTGNIDVLTLASARWAQRRRVTMPEAGIDLFADMAVEHNPGVRVLVQHSWGDPLTEAILGPPLAEKVPTNKTRDAATGRDLARFRTEGAAHLEKLREQIEGINDRHGRQLAHLVPVNEVILRLRESVVGGALAGVKVQSRLFRDAQGHGTQPTIDGVSYAWFAALYRQSPVGLKSLVNPEDADAPAQHAVLQGVAWNAVLDEPLSGVEAT